MKNTALTIVVALISLTSFADSPLTSTTFIKAYSKENIAKQVLEENKRDTEQNNYYFLWDYLVCQDNPIAVKMSCISGLKTSLDGTTPFDSFYSYLCNKNGYKDIENMAAKADKATLMCAAYLYAMSHTENHDVLVAASSMARQALRKDPASYTMNIVSALIEAQAEFRRGKNADYCRIGKLTDDVRHNSNLRDDMNEESKKIIFGYMDIYLCKESHGDIRPADGKWIVDTKWTDGSSAFVVEPMDGFLNFSGGNLHEGGYCFGLVSKADNYELCLGYISPAFNGTEDGGQISIKGEKGDKVVLKDIENAGRYLVVYDKSGTPTDVLTTTEDLRNTIETDMVEYYLAGEYKASNGTTFIFHPDEKKAEGFSKNVQSYTFGEEYESPTNIIVLDDGRAFRVNKTDKGLDFISTKYNAKDDFWTDGKPFASTVRTKRPSTVSGINGDFPFASARLLTRGELSLFRKSELSLMRNEIFARNGYIFNNETLKKRFEATSWYKGTKDSKTISLSEIEQINVALIKQMEASNYNIGE